MQQKLQSLWHVRANLPQQEKSILSDPEARLTAEDLNRMAGGEQSEFLEYTKENMPAEQYQKAFGSGQAPHYFEALRGAGTPEQQQAAKNYAQQHYNWMEQSRQNILPTHKARQLAHSDEMAREVGDIALKNTMGFNTKSLEAISKSKGLGETAWNTAAVPGGAAISLGSMLIPGLSGFRAAGSAPKAIQGLGRFFAPFQYGNVAGRAAEATGASPEVQDVTESAVSTGASGLSALRNLAKGFSTGLDRFGNRFIGYGKVSPGTAVDAGLTGYFASKIPGEASQALNAPKTPQQAQSQEFQKALTEGNLENLPQPSLGVAAGEELSRQFSPEFSGTNVAPRYGQLESRIKGIPGYYAASAYSDLGPAAKTPEGAALDEELANLPNLLPQEQGPARLEAEQKVQSIYGIGVDEYQQFKTTNTAIQNARNNLEKSVAALNQHVSTVGGGATDPRFQEAVNQATLAYDQVNQQAAKTLVPIMSKTLDHRFKQEIAPMEQDLGNLGQMSKQISDKIANNQPLDDADMAVIEQGQKYVSKIRDFSFDKAKLEFMKNGNLSDPKIARLFDDKSEQNVRTLNSMFSGSEDKVVGPDGQEIIIDIKDENGNVIGRQPMTQNNNPLINAAKNNFISAIDEASGGQITQEQQQAVPEAPVAPPAAPVVPGAPPAPAPAPAPVPTPAPGMFESFVNNVWNNLSDTQKQISFAGLGLAALGILSMFLGDDDDEEGGSGLGGLLTILGIGLGAGPSLMQYFGLGGAAKPTAPPEQQPGKAPATPEAAKGAPAPAPAAGPVPSIADIRATAATDPNKASDMIVDMAKADPKLKQNLDKIDQAARFGWKNPLEGFARVDAKYIANASKGALTEQDAQMLIDNWPLISSKLKAKKGPF